MARISGGRSSGIMLSMSSGFNVRREERHQILADNIEGVLNLLSKWGSVSDETHSLLKQELEELDLLPREPLGADFYIYVRELSGPLRAGNKRTQEFIRDWRGRRL